MAAGAFLRPEHPALRQLSTWRASWLEGPESTDAQYPGCAAELRQEQENDWFQ
jgi:hypothetical protein